ncbi:MAG: LLM class flavin-dependent oxidoreductase [Gammaproteobacteria bacterium]|nr:LLM class flavin-dependent oxidoreductase [Gammaproteobacteria bacterium]MCP5198959.1 LLM class flavin-dependent oxidoreductase [Gammaproteobacteria bacterium]
MKLGMLHLFENPVGHTEHEVVKNQIELMIEAERLGYDSVWPAEHHFSEYGYCASPQVSLAAVAARTSRIRLGTGIVILPFHHPVRVAEDFAFIDLMSDGRVDFGVGRGYQPTEYKGFGLDQTKSREMFFESLDIIKKCWTEDRFSYQGQFWQFDDICVRPKPLQQPHPPIYMACLSPGTFEVAGRQGYDVMMSTVFGLTPEAARQGLADYKRGRAEAGLDPDGGKIACLVMVYPGKTREAARKTFGPRVDWYYHTIAKYVAPPKGQQDVAGYEGYGEARDLAASLKFEDIVDGTSVICGEPEYCTEKLLTMARDFGFDELLCWTRIGGLENAKVLSAMELLGTDIIPAVRKASLSAAA